MTPGANIPAKPGAVVPAKPGAVVPVKLGAVVPAEAGIQCIQQPPSLHPGLRGYGNRDEVAQ